MTSKPSTTNCPKTFFQVHTFNCIVVNETTEQQNNKTTKQQFYKYSFVQSIVNLISGGYCGGVPPLPIPNREVKPTCADGTAIQCGRVGRRLLSMKSLRFRKISEAFFVYLHRDFSSSDFTDESDGNLAYRITHGFPRIFGRWPMARARNGLLLFFSRRFRR